MIRDAIAGGLLNGCLFEVIGSRILIQRSSGISWEDLGVQIFAITGAANSKNLSHKRLPRSFRQFA